MEDKQDTTLIELDNFDDYLNSLESEAYHYYDKHIEQFGKVKIQMRQKAVLLDKSTIEECRETLKKIAKYNSIIEDILTEEIMDYSVDQNKFDSVKARFNDRNSLLLGMKNIFETYIFGINLRIEELRDMPQHKPATSKEEKKGFDLGLDKPQLESLHNTLIEQKLLVKCEFKHFENAFNSEVLAEDFKQLKWNKSKAVLSLFVGLLNHGNKWKIAETVFENCNSRNLAKAFSNCNELDKHKPNIRLFQRILP